LRVKEVAENENMTDDSHSSVRMTWRITCIDLVAQIDFAMLSTTDPGMTGVVVQHGPPLTHIGF
jgi:hypothetical protein